MKVTRFPAIVQTIKEVNKMKKFFEDSRMELILFGSDVLTTSSDDGSQSADNLDDSMTVGF